MLRVMTWSVIGLTLLPGTALAACILYAPHPSGEDVPTFSGEAELGYTHLSGNTDSQTLIGKSQLSWLTGNWTHTLRGEVRNVTRDDETSAEQYLLSLRERYDLHERHYLFGFGRDRKSVV